VIAESARGFPRQDQSAQASLASFAASANKQHWQTAEELSAIPPKEIIKPVPMLAISLGRCLASMLAFVVLDVVCMISGQWERGMQNVQF
jgi:hypothetical protein